jgi:hypothetical protein
VPEGGADGKGMALQIVEHGGPVGMSVSPFLNTFKTFSPVDFG